MRLPANSVNLIRGGNVIKRGDETPLTFQFNDEAGDLVELTGATVTVRLANSKVLILEKPATVNEDHTVTFSIDDEETTGFGEMRLEFEVVHENGKTEIFPAQGYQEITITPSLQGMDTGYIRVVTLEEFENRLNASIERSDDASLQAIESAERADQAVQSVEDAVETVNTAVQEANDAGSYATTQGDYAKSQGDRAGTEADNLETLKGEVSGATDRANESADRADIATGNAEEATAEALRQAKNAGTQADHAKRQGDYALSSADEAVGAGEYATEQGNYAREQGEFAQREATDLSGLKADVTTAIDQANASATEASRSASDANISATEAQEQATYAETQGNYAKEQGDHAREQAQLIEDIFEDGSVQSVNGQTGIVNLDADDVGAETPEGAQAKADQAEQNAIDHADNAIAEIPEPTWENVTGKPETFTPSDHDHSIAEVKGLQESLDGKVDQVEGQGLSSNDFTDEEKTKLSGIEDGAEVNTVNSVNGQTGDVTVETFSGEYGDLSGIPESFPPDIHTHSFNDLEDIPTEFNPTDHSHSYAEITEKPTVFPPEAHDHDDRYYREDEVDTMLSGKSDTGHSHDYSEIINPPTIPTSTSQLTNDSDFTTQSDLTNATTGLATSDELDTVTGALLAHGEDIASTTTIGHVKVDGETITITSDGTISSQGGGNFDPRTSSVEIGLNAIANTVYDISIGENSSSDGVSESSGNVFGAIAIGKDSYSKNAPSISIGEEANAIGNTSIALGHKSSSEHTQSISIGGESSAIAIHSLALGLRAKSEGRGDIAIGHNALAQGTTTSISHAIAIGHQAEATGNSSTALGRGASATGNSSTALGREAVAEGQFSVAMGVFSESPNAFHGVLGSATGGGVSSWVVPGTFTVNGTKNFEMPHPKPEKKVTHVIRHGAVESPTAGDTLYRYKVTATTENDIQTIDLPDYFIHLNKDVQIFVTPQGHFGNGYGILNEESEQLEIHCQTEGEYNVLVIGTRDDDHESVQEWDIKGVEREIGESWTGETYVFQDDEIIAEEEFIEEEIA